MKTIDERWLYGPFTNFFEKPSHHSLEALLKNSGGESRYFDFKAEWPAKDKIAKHVLALANSGGGCLIIGVSENKDGTLSAVGANELVDKSDITKKIHSYIPDGLLEHIHIIDFSYDEDESSVLKGKKFQVAFIVPPQILLPAICARKSDNLKEGCIYVRRGTDTTEANGTEIHSLINKRIEADVEMK